MKSLLRALLPVVCLWLVAAGCKTQEVSASEAIPSSGSTLQEKKQILQSKHKPTFQMPQTLGGIVKSDEWVIYKDKEQEEFTGHVSYDSDIYTFRADYALSDRKANTVTAKRHVYLKKKELPDTVYEAFADEGHYNYKSGKGKLGSTTTSPVRIVLTDSGQTVKASAKQLVFDTQSQIFTLSGNARVTRTTAQGVQTLQADKITFKQLENYLYLQGNAKISDQARMLEADSIIYDEKNNLAHAYGARPLATGTTDQGTFAIIADDIHSDAQADVVFLEGRVQGWAVVPALNENKMNTQF